MISGSRKAVDRMRIVCFGDSVTRGITRVKGRLRIIKDNYPDLLRERLAPREVEVVNQGVFNDDSEQLKRRLAADVLSLNPDYVIIQIGGNDCNFHWQEIADRPNQVHAPIVPLGDYADNVRKIVADIATAGSTPILSTLLPLDPARYYQFLTTIYGTAISHWIAVCGGIEHWHGMYNRILKQLADSLHCALIDVRRAFKQAGELSALLSDDGIHPTAEGYRVFSDAVHEGLLVFVNSYNARPLGRNNEMTNAPSVDDNRLLR